MAIEHCRKFWIVLVSRHDAIQSIIKYDNVKVTEAFYRV